jgi:unsaturated rhamnogalacturonyl hydrolase
MTRTLLLVLAGAFHICASHPASAQTAPATDRLEQALRALPISDALPPVVDAAGLTASGRRLWSLEPAGGPDASKRKVVIVGGLDGSPESTAAVMRVLHWWFTHRDAAVLRNDWQLAAVPCARPGHCDADPTESLPAPLTFPPAGGFFDGKLEPTPHYVWRWTTMQAPTIVVEIRVGWPLEWEANALATTLVDAPAHAGAGSLAAALGAGGHGAASSVPVPAVRLTARTSAVAQAVRDLLRASTGAVSPLRTASLGRVSRSPIDVARLLAPKYPAQAIMSYIPALSWSGSLRLARMTGETGYRAKPIAEMLPFLEGETPALVEPYVLTSLAGLLAFADWASTDDNKEAGVLAQNAADLILPQTPGEIVRFPRGWTDDMFMATSVLARVAARTKEDRYGAAVGRLLLAYAADLQRPDGLFIHAKDGAHAWGRGNGFAAFGLIDALTHLPAPWPDRARVLQSYQALMKGLLAQQAADGMWRQVVDEPGSYREFTVTAMMVTAMARGLRLGWIDASYRPALERAWRGLLARIAEDGTLMDVCTGTGSGPTREYYLNRAALTGADDRGGAMGLTAALEMEELARSTVRK